MRDARGGMAEREGDSSLPEMRADLSGRPDMAQPTRRWAPESPAPVYDIGGQRVGTLNLASPTDYLVVQRSGAPDLYIPLGAVNRSDESGIYLALSQADLADRRWLTPPVP